MFTEFRTLPPSRGAAQPRPLRDRAGLTRAQRSSPTIEAMRGPQGNGRASTKSRSGRASSAAQERG